MPPLSKKLELKRVQNREKLHAAKERYGREVGQLRAENMNLLLDCKSVISWCLGNPLKILAHKYLFEKLKIKRFMLTPEALIAGAILKGQITLPEKKNK